jgi:hypothetical protein
MLALPLGVQGRAGSVNLLDGDSSISGFLAHIGALALMGGRNRQVPCVEPAQEQVKERARPDTWTLIFINTAEFPPVKVVSLG